MKQLGKIKDIRLGYFYDHRMFGVQIDFSLDGGSLGIGDGGKHTINIAKHDEYCKWTEEERSQGIVDLFWTIQNWTEQAKVDNFRNLRGVPVEVEINNGTFEDFRILTEVL